MKYLLDTNICIYIIKKKPEIVLKKVQTLSPNDICVSSITVAELRYGVEKSQHVAKNQQALEWFLLPLSIMPFNMDAAISYGKIRAELEAKGQPIGSLDILIAAHALSLGYTVVTNNTREFNRVPGLRVENWATP